jgi:hypothetical protein
LHLKKQQCGAEYKSEIQKQDSDVMPKMKFKRELQITLGMFQLEECGGKSTIAGELSLVYIPQNSSKFPAFFT